MGCAESRAVLSGTSKDTQTESFTHTLQAPESPSSTEISRDRRSTINIHESNSLILDELECLKIEKQKLEASIDDLYEKYQNQAKTLQLLQQTHMKTTKKLEKSRFSRISAENDNKSHLDKIRRMTEELNAKNHDYITLSKSFEASSENDKKTIAEIQKLRELECKNRPRSFTMVESLQSEIEQTNNGIKPRKRTIKHSRTYKTSVGDEPELFSNPELEMRKSLG